MSLSTPARRLEVAKRSHIRDMIVDPERREVVDLLQDRTTTGTAEWFGQHPNPPVNSIPHVVRGTHPGRMCHIRVPSPIA
jgi:hypothetical protein